MHERKHSSKRKERKSSKKEDKIKYLNYLTGIANRYLKEKRSCPLLRMIVIYTGDIKRKQISAEYNIGAVKVTLEPAFLSELDSDSIFRHLKYKVEKNAPLDDEELMKFIILPLSYRKKEEKEEKIRETVKLAAQLQDRGQQLFTLAGILAFTDKLIDDKTANKIRRMIEMTKVARIFEEEKLQALAKAEEEKRLALAEAEKNMQVALTKAKKDKKLALTKAKKDKKLALAKADEDKKLALAKADEDKKLALAKEKRENVLKMLRKNYPSEEIASIISGFSADDIDAMRRELAETGNCQL